MSQSEIESQNKLREHDERHQRGHNQKNKNNSRGRSQESRFITEPQVKNTYKTTRPSKTKKVLTFTKTHSRVEAKEQKHSEIMSGPNTNLETSLKDCVCVQVEKIINIKLEKDFTFTDETSTEKSVQPKEDFPTSTTQQNASEVAPPDIHLLEMDDGSSSINRVLSWDPWAELNIMKNDITVTSTIDENAQPPHQAESMGCCVTSSHSATLGRITSILKSSPRRVCSDVANTTSGATKESRLELLPIGDTVADFESPSLRRVNKHVQWHSEVQVIYYTGDADGGVVLSTQVEPLHEEAEQQARSIQFSREGAKSLSTIPTLENWFPQLTVNK